MDNLYCTGEEKDLSECRFDGWGSHDCTEAEGAGVICVDPDREVAPTATTPKPIKHRIKVFVAGKFD